MKSQKVPFLNNGKPLHYIMFTLVDVATFAPSLYSFAQFNLQDQMCLNKTDVKKSQIKGVKKQSHP